MTVKNDMGFMQKTEIINRPVNQRIKVKRSGSYE